MEQNELFAFVLMPFDGEFDDIYQLGIKQTAVELGVRTERVDEQKFRLGILEQIYQQIEKADFVVADMTGRNPNVFYEVGFAHAKGKLCILLTQNADDIPFDLKHHRHVIYGDSITTLRQLLAAEVEWARQQVVTARDSRLKVNLKGLSGRVTLTQYLATGQVDFVVDLHNRADRSSPAVEAIYFYCGPGWALKQDERECGRTDSDVQPFVTRHFLAPPVRVLPPRGWAQLKFSGTKVMGTAFKGDLKDSYSLAGSALLRLMTSEGQFDYPLDLSVTIDDMPF
jgi:nucleoside 2-deoxyribosyltransferase